MLLARTLTLCCLLWTGTHVLAQELIMDGKPITTCSGIFTDSGGNDQGYFPNENMEATICPDGTGGTNGTHIRLDFTGVLLGDGDALCFYDDDFANPSRLLACASDFKKGKPFIVQASAANNTGCITVTFSSDGNEEGPGWSAELTCITNCQNIKSQLAGSTPAVTPVDTGWMDVCPGQRVFFDGKGVYNQNNLVYSQSDGTSTFEWDFGDGSKAFGPQANHIFEKSGGYVVQLTITDQKGCKNINYLNQRVRVSPRPDFQVNNALLPALCTDDTITLRASLTGSGGLNIIEVNTVQSSFSPGGIRSDSLALPDGTGTSYKTPIKITGFRPGQKLTSVDDLKSICVNMEHSWMRDLEVSITCPNGSSAILHDHPGNVGGLVELGLPIDGDGTNPTPGTGYDYCWTPDANRGTWLNYANSTFGLFGAGTMPAGDYATFDPLTNLEGCPLNGDWEIEVRDWWAQDNGFIFSWSINFDESLFPDLETFQPGFVNGEWVNNNSVINYTKEEIIASPSKAGVSNFVFRVEDNFGCTWDSLIQATILPPKHPDCHNCEVYENLLADATICAGDSLTLDASPLSNLTEVIAFENASQQRIGYDNYPPANPYEAVLPVSYINPEVLSDPLNQVKSVCFDMDTDFAWDLQVYLKAPDGRLLELTTNNGGLGSYKNTCFVPAASSPITSAGAPFTGDFQPEGNWNVLSGAPINGDWALVISDAAGRNTFGSLNFWSISFENETTVSFDWDNVQYLSCSNCPTPNAAPDQNTTFTVQIDDNYGCTTSNTASIDVFSSPAPQASCNPLVNGMLEINWPALQDADYYEININGNGWQQVNQTTYSAGPFQGGSSPTIEVRAFFSATSCYSDISTTICQVLACDLLTTVDVTSPTCVDAENGEAIVHTSNGTPPYLYSLNGGAFGPDSTFSNLPNGNYSVIVMDGMNCRDTVDFSVVGQTGFTIDMQVVNHVSCFGGSDGRATVNLTGATSPVDFQWNDPLMQGTQTASNLSGGQYSVTVTDANNCEGSGSVIINEPPELNLRVSVTDVDCYGANSGSIRVIPSGGVPPHTYNWNDPAGQTTPTARNLAPGNYTVTVTDANGCQKTIGGQINEPASALVINVVQSRESCFGKNNSQAMVSASGGTGNNYLIYWENGDNTTTVNNLRNDEFYSVTVQDENGCTAIDSVFITQLDSITINTTAIAPTCFDGADGRIGVTFVEGGNPAGVYDYEWDNGETGPLLTGLIGNWYYTVTVSDIQGCTGKKTIYVDRPEEIQFDINKTDVACFNGTEGNITLSNITGEHPIQSYQWDANTGNQTGPSAMNLAAGRYFVTLTDTVGCTKTQSVEIKQPSAIEITFEVVDNDCYGDNKGEISASVKGGVPYNNGPLYLLDWSNGQAGFELEGLNTGLYTVTVQDQNNCIKTGEVEVGSAPAMEGNLEAENVSCNGDRDGRITIDVEGGKIPLSYSLDGVKFNGSPVLIGLPAGSYTVYVKDANDCVWIDQTFIREPAPFTVDAGPSAIEIFEGESVQLQAVVENGVGNVQLSWTEPFGGTLSCLNCPNPVATPSNSLRYQLYGVDENGCEAEDMIAIWVKKERIVMVPTGFSPNGDNTNDLLLVHGKEGTYVNSFRVFNRWGELVFETGDFYVNDKNTGWDGRFRGKDLHSGVYIWHLEVEYEDGAVDNISGETTLLR